MKGCFRYIQKKGLCLAREKAYRRNVEEQPFSVKDFRQQEECMQFLQMRLKYLAEGYTGNIGGDREGT